MLSDNCEWLSCIDRYEIITGAFWDSRSLLLELINYGGGKSTLMQNARNEIGFILEKIVYIALAGAAGTLTRYGVGILFQRMGDEGATGMPWGTFFANMVGALLFGLIWALSEERGWVSGNIRLIVLVGFMGAFTTFSTFAFDNFQMARASEWGWFGANLALTNIGGLACVYAGFRLARSL